MNHRRFHLLCLVVIPASIWAQATCDNFGTSNGNGCSCPVGFGGADCSLPACGGDLFQGTTVRSLSHSKLLRWLIRHVQRPVAQPSPGGSYASVTGCTCEAGWTGTGCNGTFLSKKRVFDAWIEVFLPKVCTTDAACQTGFTQAGPHSDFFRRQSENTTIVCYTGLRVFSGAQMSCKVNVFISSCATFSVC